MSTRTKKKPCICGKYTKNAGKKREDIPYCVETAQRGVEKFVNLYTGLKKLRRCRVDKPPHFAYTYYKEPAAAAAVYERGIYHGGCPYA